MPITHCGKFIDIAVDLISGADCKVWSFAIICPGVRLGQRVVVGSKVYIGRGATIGDDVHIQDGSHLTDGITIGQRVFIGAGVLTSNDKYPSIDRSRLRLLKPEAYEDAVIRPPIIEDEVMIGNGANILPGVRLGRGCQIGAGAVVCRDVPAGETWVGNPAHLIHRKTPQPASSLADDLGIDLDLYTQVCCAQEPTPEPRTWEIPMRTASVEEGTPQNHLILGHTQLMISIDPALLTHHPDIIVVAGKKQFLMVGELDPTETLNIMDDVQEENAHGPQ